MILKVISIGDDLGLGSRLYIPSWQECLTDVKWSCSSTVANQLLPMPLPTEYPWPLHMSEATGFTVRDLRKCCLNIYDRCLTDKYVVEDHRKVKMESVSNRCVDVAFTDELLRSLSSYNHLFSLLYRFSEKRFNSVGKYEVSTVHYCTHS